MNNVTTIKQRIISYADDDFHVYTCCRVQLFSSVSIAYYRTEEHTMKRDDAVFVPESDAHMTVRDVILTVERHMRFSIPQPAERILEIVGRIE